MTSLLILSFSPIASDARVLKQVREFTRDYDVTTCGYGPAPEGVVRHIRIPDDQGIPWADWRLMFLRAYRVSYWRAAGVRWVMRTLKKGAYDIILANDIEAVPIAVKQRARLGVHADLHEYTPLMHEEFVGWRKRRMPYYEWMGRRYARRARSSTTVGSGIARAWEENIGIHPEVATNAAPYVETTPQPVADPMRAVYSGAALRDRGLDETVQGVLGSKSAITLDLYLMPNDPGFIQELRDVADESDGRIRVLDPVPHARLEAVLRDYDVGIVAVQPRNFNSRWALPNKLFDYVQARLAVIVGPLPEMEAILEAHGVGVVMPGFDAPALSKTLDELTPEDVRRMKDASHRSAHDLSAESQVAVWRRAIDAIASRKRR
jgi:hypothetical protein